MFEWMKKWAKIQQDKTVVDSWEERTLEKDMVFTFSGNKSKKGLEEYINNKPDCKFISCARAKNSSGFVLKFSCRLSTVSATLPEECHIFIDKYNLSITEVIYKS